MTTFKDYVLQLNNFLKEHPEITDKPCVYVTDDEGNSYNFGVYGPSIKYVESSINLEKAYSLDCFDIVSLSLILHLVLALCFVFEELVLLGVQVV